MSAGGPIWPTRSPDCSATRMRGPTCCSPRASSRWTMSARWLPPSIVRSTCSRCPGVHLSPRSRRWACDGSRSAVRSPSRRTAPSLKPPPSCATRAPMATGLGLARAQRPPALRFGPDGLAPETVSIVMRVDGSEPQLQRQRTRFRGEDGVVPEHLGSLSEEVLRIHLGRAVDVMLVFGGLAEHVGNEPAPPRGHHARPEPRLAEVPAPPGLLQTLLVSRSGGRVELGEHGGGVEEVAAGVGH